MSLTFALLALAGLFVTICATVAADLLRGRPTELRWHIRRLARAGMVAGGLFMIARILSRQQLTADPELALLAVSLAVVMALRAHSEIRRQREAERQAEQQAVEDPTP